jgi:hypothetical protein
MNQKPIGEKLLADAQANLRSADDNLPSLRLYPAIEFRTLLRLNPAVSLNRFTQFAKIGLS